MDSYFHGVKYFGRFDLVLAHKTSMANPAANPVTFVHVFSVGFIFRFMSEILVQKCTIFAFVFWLVYLGLKTGCQDLGLKSLPNDRRDFPWYFGNKPHI